MRSTFLQGCLFSTFVILSMPMHASEEPGLPNLAKKPPVKKARDDGAGQVRPANNPVAVTPVSIAKIVPETKSVVEQKTNVATQTPDTVWWAPVVENTENHRVTPSIVTGSGYLKQGVWSASSDSGLTTWLALFEMLSAEYLRERGTQPILMPSSPEGILASAALKVMVSQAADTWLEGAPRNWTIASMNALSSASTVHNLLLAGHMASAPAGALALLAGGYTLMRSMDLAPVPTADVDLGYLRVWQQ